MGPISFEVRAAHSRVASATTTKIRNKSPTSLELALRLLRLVGSTGNGSRGLRSKVVILATVQ